MNKAELVDQIKEETNFTKDKSKEALDATVKAITNALKDGEKVQLTGFGTWEVKKRKSRKGRNPQTGEEIQIPEKTVAKFKASKSLDDDLNN